MSDAVLQDLIVRLASDEGFAGSVRAQPTILDGFDLTREERATLVSLGADAGPGATGLAERQSKSSLLFMSAGHHVTGHVNISTGPETHTHGLANHGPQQHDVILGHDKLVLNDTKVHESLGGGKEGNDPGPIQHDAKISPAGAITGFEHGGLQDPANGASELFKEG